MQEPKTSVEICTAYNLNNVDYEFTDLDYQNLTNYKLFSQHMRPLIVAENPKSSMSKVVILPVNEASYMSPDLPGRKRFF